MYIEQMEHKKKRKNKIITQYLRRTTENYNIFQGGEHPTLIFIVLSMSEKRMSCLHVENRKQ